MKVEERLELLADLGRKIEEKRDAFVKALAEDLGQAMKVTNAEIDLTVEHLKTMEEDLPHLQDRQPYGIVGMVLPYDAPTVMFARWAGAAILGGNRVRVSFSSQTPLTNRLMAELCQPYGDWVEVITDMDNREFGLKCVEDPEVRVFFISGSGMVGRVYESAADLFDKVIYAGPGGMPPLLLFSGADVEKAAKFAAKRAFLNGGQYCTTIKRVLVNKGFARTFAELFLEEIEKIKVGDPMDPDTDYGPIKVKRTRELFERALNRILGPVVTGGPPKGEWIEPTIVIAKSIPDTEVFGPFVAIKVVGIDDAIVMDAASTRFPLIAYAFGKPPLGGKGRLEATYGRIYWDPDFTYLKVREPFGGRRESGWVLEKKRYCLKRRGGALNFVQELTRPKEA